MNDIHTWVERRLHMYILQQTIEYNIEKYVLSSFTGLIQKGTTIDATLDFISQNLNP